MTSNLSVILKKYSVPALFFIAGVIMLYIGITKNQGLSFNLASVLMLIAGALSIMFSSGNFKSTLVYIFGGAAGIAGLVSLFLSGTSVHDSLTYQENYAHCKSLATQNLQDIRFIQKSHKEKTGKFLKSWEEIIEFTNNGTVPFVVVLGDVPSRRLQQVENQYLYTGNPPTDNDMTEQEAYRLSKWTEGPYYYQFANFKRDTIQRRIMELKFENKTYIKTRKQLGFTKFSPDSLSAIPFTNGKELWSLQAEDSIKGADDITFPTIRVEGNIPFANIQGKNGDNEEMYFGSLKIEELGGSWEEN